MKTFPVPAYSPERVGNVGPVALLATALTLAYGRATLTDAQWEYAVAATRSAIAAERKVNLASMSREADLAHAEQALTCDPRAMSKARTWYDSHSRLAADWLSRGV